MVDIFTKTTFDNISFNMIVDTETDIAEFYVIHRGKRLPVMKTKKDDGFRIADRAFSLTVGELVQEINSAHI